MKKIAVTTLLILVGTFIANAETQVGIRSKVELKARALQMMASSTRIEAGVDGNSAMGAQIRALNIEMESKIKAIRDEYQVKMRAIIGTQVEVNGTTSRPMMGRTINENYIPPMPRIREEGQLRAEVSQNSNTGGMMKFMRGLFGIK